MPEKIQGHEYIGTYYTEAALVSKEAIEAIHGLNTPLSVALAFQILPKYIRVALLEAQENPDKRVVLHLPTCAHRQQLIDVVKKYEITNLELI